uniref:Protein kinase domain-containing protein n=1 Tax=Iridovirus LCIVAC01 TaxID=2506607 RepID=A0A481YQB5_9VIRU|nr:MAG: hypothetical protein LCIVAC01_01770 [Iridovirus LCIVAC01]
MTDETKIEDENGMNDLGECFVRAINCRLKPLDCPEIDKSITEKELELKKDIFRAILPLLGLFIKHYQLDKEDELRGEKLDIIYDQTNIFIRALIPNIKITDNKFDFDDHLWESEEPHIIKGTRSDIYFLKDNGEFKYVLKLDKIKREKDCLEAEKMLHSFFEMMIYLILECFKKYADDWYWPIPRLYSIKKYFPPECEKYRRYHTTAFIMEKLNYSLLEAISYLDISEILYLGCQVAVSIQNLRTKMGFIHLDLLPRNILLKQIKQGYRQISINDPETGTVTTTPEIWVSHEIYIIDYGFSFIDVGKCEECGLDLSIPADISAVLQWQREEFPNDMIKFVHSLNDLVIALLRDNEENILIRAFSRLFGNVKTSIEFVKATSIFLEKNNN